MPSRAYHEQLWEAVPAGVEPPGFAPRLRFLLAHVNTTQRPERVLDVGCGEGAFAAELAHAGAHVVGIDVAEEPLRRARERHPGLDLRLVAPEAPWELADASFDVVWAGEVIEHIFDTGGFMSEVRRVLRSGGRLLLSTPAHGRRELLALALSRRAFAAHFDPRADHVRFYSRTTLRGLLEELRFEDVQVSVGRFERGERTLLAQATRARF